MVIGIYCDALIPEAIPLREFAAVMRDSGTSVQWRHPDFFHPTDIERFDKVIVVNGAMCADAYKKAGIQVYSSAYELLGKQDVGDASEAQDYSAMSIADLKELAAERGIKVHGNASRSKIIDLLEA